MVIGSWFVPAGASAHVVAAGKSQPVEWAGFAGNAQHTSVAQAKPQPLDRIRWRVKVDRHPFVILKSLPTHYGSPMITAANTVLVPTKTTAKAGYRVIAYSGANGRQRWSLSTDYRLAVFGGNINVSFGPPLPAALTPADSLAVAGIGGTVLVRANADQSTGSGGRLVFYGAAQWNAHRSAYNQAVQVTTPITSGPDGSLYFGFTVKGTTPDHLASGIARIAPNGHATWIAASAAARSKAVSNIAFNCAPALSPNGKTLYIAVTIKTGGGFLVGLDAATLQPRFKAALKDPSSGLPAMISPSTSASPTIGPDGDVYYGVLENPFPKHDDRGWLLHFNASLTKEKIPGSFGWDNTPSVLPASAVPSYHGKSAYLLVSKYNNYWHIGPHGDGHNEVAVLDPDVAQKDPFSSVQVMKPVQTVLSPVQAPKETPGARYEWCINAAVVDLANDSVYVNNEDGFLYRWDLASDTLAEKMLLNKPRPEAYTSTLVGPDGTVYAINNATLYAIGR